MTFDDYQHLSARTRPDDVLPFHRRNNAVLGIASEAGEMVGEIAFFL